MPKFEMLSIKEIELDKTNPRIARIIEMYGDKVTAEGIALALGSGSSSEEQGGGPSFMGLKQSILTNGSIIHPIIVNREKVGGLIVIEGNTRVQIYKEFNDQGVEGNWEKVPAMIYEDMDKPMIDAIRLQAHLVGTRAWDPYSKAKYLHSLSISNHLPLSQMVDFCGGNKHEVSNYINAYIDMEKYYRQILNGDTFDATRFSAFVELQKSRIAESVVNAGFTKSDFAQWIHEKRIHPVRFVRALPRILQDKKAREVFLKEDIEEAIKVLDAPSAQSILTEATLEDLALEISKRIAGLPYKDMKKLRDASSIEKREILGDAKDALSELVDDICEERNEE